MSWVISRNVDVLIVIFKKIKIEKIAIQKYLAQSAIIPIIAKQITDSICLL